MPAGWTRDSERFGNLERVEKLWLDPLRAELPEEEAFASDWLRMAWPEQVGKRFANWLNSQLDGKLAFGETEARRWKQELLADEGNFCQQLERLRRRLGHVPASGSQAEIPAQQGGAQ